MLPSFLLVYHATLSLTCYFQPSQLVRESHITYTARIQRESKGASLPFTQSSCLYPRTPSGQFAVFPYIQLKKFHHLQLCPPPLFFYFLFLLRPTRKKKHCTIVRIIRQFFYIQFRFFFSWNSIILKCRAHAIGHKIQRVRTHFFNLNEIEKRKMKSHMFGMQSSQVDIEPVLCTSCI